MFDRLEAAVGETEAAMAVLDPNELVGKEPARAVELLVAHERRVAACRTRLAGRVAETNSWDAAHRTAADWLADTAGTSVGAARDTLATAGRMEALPVVQEAFEAGKLSEAQAREVAKAAEADPAAQPELVRTAGHETLRKLKQRCGRVIAAADPDDKATYERIHGARSLSWDTDSDGTWRLRGSFTADAGAAIRSRLEAECEAVFKQAHEEGRRERLDAYMADALVCLCRADPSEGSGSKPRREAVILIDLAALRRGCTLSGETCEIAGLGAIPVEIAKEMLDDAFIKAVIRDGTELGTIAHYGRHCPAILATALQLRDPTCAVPRCDNPRLEIDHNQPFAEGGPHSIRNDNRLCRRHHHQKTHEGHELVGEPGRRTWLGPEGSVISRDPPYDTDPDPPGSPRSGPGDALAQAAVTRP